MIVTNALLRLIQHIGAKINADYLSLGSNGFVKLGEGEAGAAAYINDRIPGRQVQRLN
jgi:hypothetical protein